MAIITIFSASYCYENDVVKNLALKLGYEIIDEELVEETSKRFNVSTQKIKSTLNGQVSFLNNITREREKNTAYIKSTLAELVKDDKFIYHGFASHLLPMNTISHILKVCIVANQEYRIKNACKMENISEKEAKSKIINDDKVRYDWVQYIYESSPWDEKLYDIVIPMNNLSVEEAVQIIAENIRKKVLQTTPESQKALNDFILSAKVNAHLVEKNYDVETSSNDGNVTISLKEFVVRFEHLKEKINEIVKPVAGVKNVEVIMGPNIKAPSRYDDLEPPPRYLLVDDEKEYIQTLSERLQTRDLKSSIVYNGEEALSYIEKDEPDVMVLDLKMPGIDGMEVLRKVKKERPHVEVIILTGHGSEKDESLALELGAFAYLEKPVDIEILSQTMKEAYKKINTKK